jgi:hypothetical protein
LNSDRTLPGSNHSSEPYVEITIPAVSLNKAAGIVYNLLPKGNLRDGDVCYPAVIMIITRFYDKDKGVNS